MDQFEKLIEKIYKDREDRRQFMSHGQMLFAAVNKEGRFEYVSDSWTKCLGMTKEAFQSMNFPLLIHPDDMALSMDEYAFYQEKGVFAVEMEVNRFRRADDTYAKIQWFGGDHDEELGLSMTYAFELPEDQEGFKLYINGYEPFNWRDETEA